MPSTTTRKPNKKTSGSTSNGSTRGEAVMPAKQRDEIAISQARTGDHISIFHLLQNVFHAPSVAEFQASQDAPQYEPSDRLLARSGTRLLGHVQTAAQVMHFDSLQLPVAEVHHLGVLPEFRGQGIGSQLLAAAEERIVDEGGRLAMLQTSEPEFFTNRGWVVCGRHCYSTATARNILAQLADVESPQQSPLEETREPLNIRLWRQIEQDVIADIYQRAGEGSRGLFQRNHAYWRWLVSRHGFDRIYVAVEGHGKPHVSDEHSPIAGYAAIRDARILELHTLPDHPQAARQLLARACAEAIERGEGIVRLDAPARSPLHRIMQQAGGRFTHKGTEDGKILLAKLFDPLALLEDLRGDIFARAKRAELSLPLDLGLMIEGEKYQLSLTRRSAKLIEGKLGRSYLTCDRAEFSRLLLGEVDVAKAEAAGTLEASTRVAVDVARVLLPVRPIWFPALDHFAAEA